MKFIKKIAAFSCVFSIVLSNFVSAPMEAYATDTNSTDIATQVEYESADIAKYWSVDTKKAPTMPGYVFGGWYIKSGGEYTALTETEVTKTVDTDGKASIPNTYAKFVPAQVASVKAQNAYGTKADDGVNASLRVVSAVDSKEYQKVGFTILVNNKNKLTTESGGELETTQIYSGLKVEGDSSSPYSAEDLFGGPAAYLSVWRVDGIKDKYDAKIFNVTPYWITMDGTKVDGLSKYVHVEDGYRGYISVPINLCDTPDVAAGEVTITYPEGLTLVEDKVEFDGVFPGSEATFYDNKNGTIKIVGNAETVDAYNTDKSILVNLRFTADSSKYPGAGKGSFLSFTVSGEDFCDWNVNPVSIDAWDVQY